MTIINPEFIDMLKSTSKAVYHYILKNKLGKEVIEEELQNYLELLELKEFMNDPEELFEKEWLEELIKFIINHSSFTEEKEFFNALGYSPDARHEYPFGFGPFWLEPIGAFLLLFILDYYNSIISGNEQEFLHKVIEWIDKDRVVTQNIFLASPLNIERIILEIDNTEIELSMYRDLKVIDFSKGIISLEVFQALPFGSILKNPEFATPSYPQEDRLNYWENLSLCFVPNTKVVISTKLSASDFHNSIDLLYRRKEPNIFFRGFEIGRSIMFFLNLLMVPSDIIDHTAFWDTKWEPLIPDGGLLLYPQRSEEEKKLLIEKSSLQKIIGSNYYYIAIDPQKLDLSIFSKIWEEYGEVLVKICEYPELFLACKRLNQSFKSSNPEQIFIELMMGLETLFAESPEITFKLTFFVSGLFPVEVRDKQMNLIKDLYNLRSIILHGGNYEKKLRKILDNHETLSNFADVIFETRFLLIVSILGYMKLLKEMTLKKKKKYVIQELERVLITNDERLSEFEETYNLLMKHINLVRHTEKKEFQSKDDFAI